MIHRHRRRTLDVPALADGPQKPVAAEELDYPIAEGGA